jgi:hypothetical protein
VTPSRVSLAPEVEAVVTLMDGTELVIKCPDGRYTTAATLHALVAAHLVLSPESAALFALWVCSDSLSTWTFFSQKKTRKRRKKKKKKIMKNKGFIKLSRPSLFSSSLRKICSRRSTTIRSR